ncbi:MAG: tRNA pseudouridine(55) synthase TruB [Bacillota bacterium]
MNGLLLVDKPEGITSHNAVAVIREICKIKKAGHSGTLDPFASGLLVVCLEEATRIVSYLPEDKKTYLAGVSLGVETDTLDYTGHAISSNHIFQISHTRLQETVAYLKNQIEQIPPQFSAIKLRGEPLYKRARRGEYTVLHARPVKFYEIKQISSPQASYSYKDLLIFSITCSKGAYIRSLARDLGRELGCGCHLYMLRRLSSGPFSLTSAYSLQQIKMACARNELDKLVIGMADALPHMPKLVVDPSAERLLFNGRMIHHPHMGDENGSVLALNEKGNLVAILNPDGPYFRPVKVFHHSCAQRQPMENQ